MTMKIGTEMPSLDGATEWLNATGAAAEAKSKGRPTLVHFWSLSCGLCKENLPRLARWRDEHAPDGLRVIAVHLPRHESDTDVEKVRDAVSQYQITEPCAVDNEHKLKDAFRNERGYVPAYYLFDAEGKLRCFAAGGLGLGLVAASLERLLAEGRGADGVNGAADEARSTSRGSSGPPAAR